MLKNVLPRVTEEAETKTGGESIVGSVVSQMDSDTDSSTADDLTTADPDEDVAVEEGSAIDLDQIFGLLKNRRRRDVLRYLAGETKQSRHGKLSERIAARECDKEISQLNSKERKRVYVALYQCHLPKMDDVGAITYNQRRGTVKRGPNFDLFEYYLPEDEDTTELTDADHNWVQSVTGFIT